MAEFKSGRNFRSVHGILDFQFQLAELYDNFGQTQLAEQHYKKVLAMQPTYKKALLNLGFLYAQHGDFKNAMDLTEKAIKADPNYTRAYENRINIYLQTGEYQKGLSELNYLTLNYPENCNYIALNSRVEEAMK